MATKQWDFQRIASAHYLRSAASSRRLERYGNTQLFPSMVCEIQRTRRPIHSCCWAFEDCKVCQVWEDLYFEILAGYVLVKHVIMENK